MIITLGHTKVNYEFLVWVKILLKFFAESSIIVFSWENSVWRLWAKALGDKYGLSDHEADMVAIIRTLIVLCYVITNIAIICGIVHHW